MKFTTATFTLALALCAAAAPVENEKRELTGLSSRSALANVIEAPAVILSRSAAVDVTSIEDKGKGKGEHEGKGGKGKGKDKKGGKAGSPKGKGKGGKGGKSQRDAPSGSMFMNKRRRRYLLAVISFEGLNADNVTSAEKRQLSSLLGGTGTSSTSGGLVRMF